MTSEPPIPGSPARLAEQHLRAENEGDLAAAMAVFTADCRYEIPALAVDLSGREAVAAYHAELLETFPIGRTMSWSSTKRPAGSSRESASPVPTSASGGRSRLPAGGS